MNIKVYTLNAFAEDENGGNPAGVVANDYGLDDNQMQKIAKEIGFSETAFVLKSDKADFKVRFFTPTEEVDFCGHATIGTFYLLKHLGIISPGRYTQETKAGVLAVDILEDGTVIMEQSKPKYLRTIEKSTDDFKEVCDSLGIKTGDTGIDFMEVVSTGLADLIVPVKSVEILNHMQPNMELIKEISIKHQITGYHVFALKTGDITAECRNFAPAVGIDEESATGSASGALGAFLVKNNLVEISENQVQMTFEQGMQMNRPSKITVNVGVNRENKRQVESVFVGGKASNVQNVEVIL